LSFEFHRKPDGCFHQSEERLSGQILRSVPAKAWTIMQM
jgi:hypothetical protein